MWQYRKTIKRLGRHLLEKVNFDLRRNLNGCAVTVPVLGGVRATVSGEKWMSGLLAELFRAGDGAFYDVGVNRGQTLLKAKTIDPARHYVGFEPNPTCCHYLQRLIAKNDWKNVVLVPSGIYSSDAVLELTGASDHDGCSTVIDAFRESLASSKLVPLLSFETIRAALPEEQATVIKIDVEGAELEVLLSLRSLIDAQRPLFIVEVWRTGDDPNKLQRAKETAGFFEASNYQTFNIECNRRGAYRQLVPASKAIGAANMDNYVCLPRERLDALRSVLTLESAG